MARRKRVDGVMHLPWPLPVQESVLLGVGPFKASIAGEQVQIELPGLREQQKRGGTTPFGGDLDPPLGHKGDDLPSQLQSTVPIWGYEASPNCYRISGATVSFMASPPRGSGGNYPELSVIAHGFHPWFDLVRDWICAWIRCPSADLGSSRGTAISMIGPNARYTGEGGGSSMTLVANAPAASLEMVLGAFSHATKGHSLPPEHHLLLQATNAMWIGDYRSPVCQADVRHLQ